MSRTATLPARTFCFSESAHRTLLLRVRKDGAISALWCVLRGDIVTHRHALPLITDANAAEVYSDAFSRVAFDFVCPRVWRDGRWQSLLHEPIPATSKPRVEVLP